MENKNENLKELLGNLLDEPDAVQAKADIQAGDKLLNEFSSPRPDPVVVSSIKKQVAAHLWIRKRRRFVRRRSELAVAAVLVIGVLLGLAFMETSVSQAPVMITQVSEWSISNDAEYSLIMSEVEEIEDRIISIRLDEDDYEVDDLVEIEIEMEMLAMDGGFWKG